MKISLHSSLLLLSLCGLAACGGDQNSTTDAANDAAGTGTNELAREVTGVWRLSTDYNYDERCNYLPVEFVRNLFKVPESATLQKYDLPNGCEVRWGNQKVGFYFEKGSPYESVYQSEYAFDKLFQPQNVAASEAASPDLDTKESNIHGPNPQGTSAERPVEGESSGSGVDASAQNDSSNQLTPNITPAAAQLAAPAQNTSTGIAINGVGDKAIWDSRKRTLHVLHLNHVMHVTAPKTGDEKTMRQGAINLAMVIMGRLNDDGA